MSFKESYKKIENAIANVEDEIDLKDVCSDISSIMIDTMSKYHDDVNYAYEKAVCCQAFVKINSQAAQLFIALKDNARDENLKIVLDSFIDILNSDELNKIVSENLENDINQAKEDGINNFLVKTAEKTFQYLVDRTINKKLPYPARIAIIGYKLALKLENLATDNIFDTDNLYKVASEMVACEHVHYALYKMYNNSLTKLNDSDAFQYAYLAHYAVQAYIAIDLKAIEFAQDYSKRYYYNNAQLSAAGGPGGIIWFTIDISKILNCKPNESFEKLVQLPVFLSRLANHYRTTTCCDFKQDWLENFKVSAYERFEKIDEDISEDELNVWYKQNEALINQEIPQSFQYTIIQCPVEVRIYDKSQNLIAKLNDNSSEIESLYQHLFFVCSEAKDDSNGDNTLVKTKAKVLILPHGTDMLTYEIIGVENGTMNICSYNVNNSENGNWCKLDNMSFSASNLTKKGRVYTIQNDGERYGLQEENHSPHRKTWLIFGCAGVLSISFVSVLLMKRRNKKE